MSRPSLPTRLWTSLIALLVLLIGFLFYLSTVDTEVTTQQVEQDVTNEVLAK